MLCPYFRNALPLLLIVRPAVALAAPAISITTESFLEAKVTQAGQTKIVLQKIKSTAPGSRVVTIVTARSTLAKPATNVVIDSKLDPNVTFDNSTDSIAVVSIDGGKTFGPLTAARVRGANGVLRPALPQEVTNIRWVVSVLPAGDERRVSYVAVVK